MKDFFGSINYSASNEDGNSELNALCFKENDRVLCITGSGSRPLDLLTGNPGNIISIDFNPTQNYLLELKMEAIKHLNYLEFIEFIGIINSKNRIEIYNKIKGNITKEAKSFWDTHLKDISSGILYCGRWEKYLQVLRKGLIFRSKVIQELFNAETITDQRIIWKNSWDNIIWKKYLAIIFNRYMWQYILKEPGIYSVANDFNIPEYIYKCFDKLANSILLNKCDYAWLTFHGRYNHQKALPIHLQEKNFNYIKSNLYKIQVITGSLCNYLNETDNNTFDAFSLSDFSSYGDLDNYKSIWTNVIGNANKGARFCERQFLVKNNPELWHKNEIKRNYNLENKLWSQDKSFIYSFIAGTIL